MCGRFTLSLLPELLAEIIDDIEQDSIPPRDNIAPTQRLAPWMR